MISPWSKDLIQCKISSLSAWLLNLDKYWPPMKIIHEISIKMGEGFLRISSWGDFFQRDKARNKRRIFAAIPMGRYHGMLGEGESGMIFDNGMNVNQLLWSEAKYLAENIHIFYYFGEIHTGYFLFSLIYRVFCLFYSIYGYFLYPIGMERREYALLL